MHSVLTIILVDVCSVSICLPTYPLYYANQWRIRDFLTGALTPVAGDTIYYYRPQTKLRKGNVFTPVCQSFCSQGGSAPGHAGIPSPRQTPLPRVVTLLVQTPPSPADGYCCGRCASYWNAFLFDNFFAENFLKMKEIRPNGDVCPKRPLLDPPLLMPLKSFVSLTISK